MRSFCLLLSMVCVSMAYACGSVSEDPLGAEDDAGGPTDEAREAPDTSAPVEAGAEDASAATDASIHDAASESDTDASLDAGDDDASLDGRADSSADASLDAAVDPSPEECLEGWRDLNGACAAPIITESYVGNGCVGTTGWFIEGANFQLDQHNVGIADYGPQSVGANGNQRHWNIITPTLLCVTVNAGFKDTWVGKTIHVVNPDGKASNSVVVGDRL